MTAFGSRSANVERQKLRRIADQLLRNSEDPNAVVHAASVATLNRPPVQVPIFA